MVQEHRGTGSKPGAGNTKTSGWKPAVIAFALLYINA